MVDDTTLGEVDVAILGAGIAGLGFANSLAAKGYANVLVDTDPFSAFASTKNQGWLQSGALYAARGQASVAKACLQGYHLTNTLAPTAVRSDINCYFLFRDQDADFYTNLHSIADFINNPAEDTEADGSQRYHLKADDVALSQLQRDEVALRNVPDITKVVATDDHPIDTHILLDTLRASAERRGVCLHTVPALSNLAVVPCQQGWQITTPTHRIVTRAVILAAGAGIPHLVSQLFHVNISDKLVVTNVPVLVINTPVTNSMFVTFMDDGPNLVPFGRRDIEGVTSCLVGYDKQEGIAIDEIAYREEHLKQFNRIIPGLNYTLTARNPGYAHVYFCQKLERSDSNVREHMWIPHSDSMWGGLPGVYSFYPGKFTSSPVGVEESLQKLVTDLGPPLGGQRVAIPSSHPRIALQKYYDPAEFRIVSRDGFLVHEALDPN